MGRQIRDMVVVITGASAGIGRQLAIDLHAGGAILALGARRVELLESLNAELGGGHLCVQCDVANEESCRRLISAATERFGRIDTLVANAGYGFPEAIATTARQQVIDIFQTNFLGTLDCIRAAVPIMLSQTPRDGFRGQVMIVSSGAARRGLPYFGVYSATKAAQLSVAEAMRVEVHGSGVAVTSVHPIGTETDFFKVAQSKGATKIESAMRVSWRQSASRVSRAMIRGIVKPRREVWTSFAARFGLALNALLPSVGDAIMLRQRREIEEMNR